MRFYCTSTALLILIAGAVILFGCSDSHAPSGTVTLYLYGRSPYTVPTSAEWAAFQDGDGPWQRISPSQEGVYTGAVSDPRGRFGFAYYRDGDLHLQQSTLAEGTTLVAFLDNGLSSVRGGKTTSARAMDLPGYYSVNGSISYTFPVSGTSVTMGSGSSSSWAISSYWFTVKEGLRDLVISDNNRSVPWEVTWLFLDRNIDVQGNMTHNVTVTPSNIVTLEPGAVLTVTGDLANARANVNFLTANGTTTSLAYADIPTGTLAFRTLPAAAMAPGDRYVAEVSAWYKRQLVCFDVPTAVTMDIPSANFDTFSVTSVVDEHHRRYPVFSGLTFPGHRGYFMYCDTYAHFVDVIVSAGWLAANGATAYQMPDLSGVDGWQASWSIAESETINDEEAMAFYGNASLATCIGQYFSPAHFMPAPGEWIGIAWDVQPPV
ncbi:MAG: hypothetical protein ACYDCO_15265 [Armatimonadota bacterium]